MRALSIVAVLLSACVAEDEATFESAQDLPIEVAGPAGSLTLSITPLVPGFPATFTVTGADANATVNLYRSSAVLPGGACGVAGLGGNCLDLRNPVTRQFRPVANGAGVASITLTLPDPLPLASVAWQAAYRNAGGFDSSSAALYTIHQPNSDADGDGVAAAEEMGIGTNPGLADTDGGGLDDGDEVAAGLDPLDPADDVAPPAPSYATDIAPIITARCGGCHTGAGNQGGRNFDTYNEMFQQSADVPALQLIEPGDPNASYLWHKINGTQATVGGAGNRMPAGGPFLNAGQLQLFTDWINGGAQP